MTRLLLAGLVCLAAPLGAQQLPPLVRLAPGVDQRAELAQPTAVVYDDAGNPLFSGAQDYIRSTYKSDGRVFAWDMSTRRVRITPEGETGAWLACADLKSMSIACAVRFATASDGGLQVLPGVAAAQARPARLGTSAGKASPARAAASPGRARISRSLEASGPQERNVPACPGDPRCPGGGK